MRKMEREDSVVGMRCGNIQSNKGLVSTKYPFYSLRLLFRKSKREKVPHR